jgi:acyl transferase domain-containing protein
MADALVIPVPRGTPVERQLELDPPAGLAAGQVVVEAMTPDAEGNLDPPETGEVVLSVPSPEALAREADEVRRVLDQAGTGVDPLVVVIEVAEELRDDELAAVLEAAPRAPRAVILRVIRSD